MYVCMYVIRDRPCMDV